MVRPGGLVFIVAPTMSAVAIAEKYYLSPAGIPTLRLDSSKSPNCQVVRITDFLAPIPNSTPLKGLTIVRCPWLRSVFEVLVA